MHVFCDRGNPFKIHVLCEDVVVIEMRDTVRAGSCEILCSFTYRILRKQKNVYVLQYHETENAMTVS